MSASTQGYAGANNGIPLTRVHLPSQPGSARPHPHSHIRVNSMSVSSGHPHHYLSSNNGYTSTVLSNPSGVYAGQGHSDLNAVNLIDPYGDPNVAASLYPYQGPTPSSPLSSATSNRGHYSGASSQISNGSPCSSPSSVSTPTIRPRTAMGHQRTTSPTGTGQLGPPGSMYPSTPNRPFECDQCRLSFTRHHDLKRHKDTHNGERVCFFSLQK